MTKLRVARPFYAEYAWAFDLIIDRPVEKECAVIVGWLVGRGILPGETILDAGCGTGRYSRELARRGYIVHGVDLSPELIAVANEAVAGRTGGVSFAVGLAAGRVGVVDVSTDVTAASCTA